MIGATDRQLDYWCSGGVFGDHHKQLGSGQRRRFTAREVLEVAIVNRIADTMHALNAGLTTSGSREMYVDVVRSIRGETVEGVTTTNVEISIARTPHSELYVTIGDLRLRFSEEVLCAEESA